jgi:hypothetical protein
MYRSTTVATPLLLFLSGFYSDNSPLQSIYLTGFFYNLHVTYQLLLMFYLFHITIGLNTLSYYIGSQSTRLAHLDNLINFWYNLPFITSFWLIPQDQWLWPDKGPLCHGEFRLRTCRPPPTPTLDYQADAFSVELSRRRSSNIKSNENIL